MKKRIQINETVCCYLLEKDAFFLGINFSPLYSHFCFVSMAIMDKKTSP